MGCMQKKKKKKYRLKKWVKVTLWVSFVISLLTIISVLLFNKYQERTPNNKEIPDISTLRLEYNNPDIMARITVDSIQLEALIAKTTDNEFYLEHDLNKKKSVVGNPYFDYRNSSDLAHEKQINIYSHNVENKQYSDYYPFAKLETLLNRDTFNKASDITIYTDNRILKYQIYAVKIVNSSENEHMRLVLNNLIEWQEHYNMLLKNTKYCKKNCQLDADDDILVLQTCYYQEKDAYILVIAKRI